MPLDPTFEVSSQALELVQHLIDELSANGAIKFIECGGFKIAVEMMKLQFPNQDPPPLIPLLHSVIQTLLAHRSPRYPDYDKPTPTHPVSLEHELITTKLFAEMMRENLLAEVKRGRWGSLLLQLEEMVPGVADQKRLYEALTREDRN